jgi:hypothetical protein
MKSYGEPVWYAWLMDAHELPYDERIATLTKELEGLRLRVEEVEAELDWWQRGRALFGSGATNGAPRTTELAPATVVFGTGAKPTLAQAIVRLMADGDRESWTAPEVMEGLRARGWMPQSKSAEHFVRSKLASLARGDDRTLDRVSHGVYALHRSGDASLIQAEGP